MSKTKTATATAKTAFLAATLKPGEEYAGIILGKDGEADHHLILLPGQANDVTWEQANEFARKAAGELPTRREQSLLFANLKEQFEERWYWSGEQRGSGSAWNQNFRNGLQLWDFPGIQLRARAVRRVAI